MLASFFRHLEEHQVEWLLISGQATILYGAATFSEDVDLWVNPTESNFERLIQALRASRARYYKLTPPLGVDLARRHHGFHFIVPHTEGQLDLYLDVMGCPPRVGTFEEARNNAREFQTTWGLLHTVGITDLVEIKKTQRPRDYPIISRLVLTFMQEKSPNWSDRDLRWALDNVFTLQELTRLLREYPAVCRVLDASSLVGRAATELSTKGQLPRSLEDELEDWLDERISPLRKVDRHFWSGVIQELRELRAGGGLMQEGRPV